MPHEDKELDEAADRVDAAIEGKTVTLTVTDSDSSIPDGGVVTYMDYGVVAPPKEFTSGYADVRVVNEKALMERIWDGIQARLKDALPTPEQKPAFGFTVYKDADGNSRWLAIYSNNFEDREGEIFSEKGFDRYVARLDMGVVPMPRLRSWHVSGTEYGTADWVDRMGHFFVASGTYDDSDAGRTGAAYDAKHWKEYGVSHGLLHRAKDKVMVDGRAVYTDWNTFEVSPLPFRRAANDLTAFAVDVSTEKALKEADMDVEKRKHLVEKFGEEYVARLEKLTEEKGKELEALRAYKDFVDPTPTDEAQTTDKALDEVNEAFKDLVPELIEGQAEALKAATKAAEVVTANTDAIAELRKEFESKLAELGERLDGAPRRASKDLSTKLAGDSAIAKGIDAMLEREKFEGGALAGLFGGNGKHEE